MEKVNEKIDELKKHDIIEKVQQTTKWVSPCIVVPKADKTFELWRLCDCSGRQPIPTVDEILYDMNEIIVFSKFGLKLEFHQIELHENSRDITSL